MSTATAGAALAARMAELGLTVDAVKAPKPGDMFHFAVTVKRNGRHVLGTTYRCGKGHAIDRTTGKPFPWVGGKRTNKQRDIDDAINRAIESGQNERSGRSVGIRDVLWPAPDGADILWCLLSDASALDCGTFEEWASDLGYDTDSRKAEKTYRACLAIGLALRAALGNDELAALQELAAAL